MTLTGGSSAQGLRVGIVVARWNELVTRALLQGAEDALRRAGVDDAAIDVAWVPGAWEIPQALRWLADTGRYDALVGLGAVIRGATPHFDFIAGAAMSGAADVARATGIPVAAGILTTDTPEQAMERAGLKHGNKGAEAAMAAVEMAGLRAAISGGGA